MPREDIAARSERVVALLAPGAALPDGIDRRRVVLAASGYEAAAELLAEEGAAALLVDLRRLTTPHRPLLEVAVERGVHVVAFGSVRTVLGSDCLSRMHLTTVESAGQVLAALIGPAGAPPTERPEPLDTQAEPHLTVPPSSYQPVPAEDVDGDEEVEGVDESEGVEPDQSAAPEEAEPEATAAAPEAEPAEPAPPDEDEQPVEPPAPIRPAAMLTEAELRALLEDLP